MRLWLVLALLLGVVGSVLGWGPDNKPKPHAVELRLKGPKGVDFSGTATDPSGSQSFAGKVPFKHRVRVKGAGQVSFVVRKGTGPGNLTAEVWLDGARIQSRDTNVPNGELTLLVTTQ